tara:strand:- start:599 stop:916 length:318 start_codon:yes stop_codon:yes gene_type:complete
MEKFEVIFVEGIEDDFLKYNIKEETILKIQAKLTLYSERLPKITQPLKGIQYKIRKYRIGKYRLFLYTKDFTIYCLAFIHRKECYKSENINKILTMVRNIDSNTP